MNPPAYPVNSLGATTDNAWLAFLKFFAFTLDDFQIDACQALRDEHSVLVAAPTGSGKTVVGEFAVHLALTSGRRAFYTTPIKALSNQKYRDLVARYGSEDVGLLTGDTVINGDAPIVVMTTEVLRNMLYDGSAAINDLSHVVMDEVHYLADRQRGAVWEEVILHLPASVTLAALSATVSNAEEFGAWLRQVRGDTKVIVEEKRPTPLHQHVLANRQIIDLFAPGSPTDVNPVLSRIAADDARKARAGGGRGRGAGRPRQGRRSEFISRKAVLDQLARANLLPAIYFLFSRRGCDEAAKQCLRSGLRLVTDAERVKIRDYVDEKCASIPDGDLSVLDYYEWRDGLERGIAAHHAGMLPLFKEAVEELFCEGLVKVVFATETLALGINMPARTVVLERLVKWNGASHADITAGEYTQLTGRAGRRGIDHQGHAVTVWHSGLDPKALAGLASTRTYPLKSSFRPSYNMAVNLVGRLGRTPARELLETSFAQFQADAGVVGIANQIRRNDEALAGYAEAMTCHVGDFAQYAGLRQQLSQRERDLARDGAVRRRESARKQLAGLRVGDVIALTIGRRAGPALVVEQSTSLGHEPELSVLTLDRRVRRIGAADVPHGVEPITRMKVPRAFDARSANWRRDLARSLAEQASTSEIRTRRGGGKGESGDEQIAVLRAELRSHPCHGCADREAHARWAERHHKLSNETQGLRRKIESRTNTVARQFDRVCAVLTDLGYLANLDGNTVVTPDGEALARLYADQDLLAAQCLRTGVWEQLSPAELSGACAALVFENRSSDEERYPPSLPPSSALRRAIEEQETLAEELAERESRQHLAYVREPHSGFSSAAWRWACGESLDSVLTDGDLAPGDFVRWCRQLIDLLSQLAQADDQSNEVAITARQAVAAMRRSVVSYTSAG